MLLLLFFFGGEGAVFALVDAEVPDVEAALFVAVHLDIVVAAVFIL